MWRDEDAAAFATGTRCPLAFHFFVLFPSNRAGAGIRRADPGPLLFPRVGDTPRAMGRVNQALALVPMRVGTIHLCTTSRRHMSEASRPSRTS
jgi:hypothetical protein